MILHSKNRPQISMKIVMATAIAICLTTPGWAFAERASTSKPAIAPLKRIADNAPANVAEKKSHTPRNADPAAALEKKVSVNFTDQHLSKILEFLSGYTGANIVVDYRAVKPAQSNFHENITPSTPTPVKVERKPFPPQAPEIEAMYATNGMVPYIKLDDVTLNDALDALCKQLGLGYEVHDNLIWVTSVDRLGKDDWATPAIPEGLDVGPLKLDASIALEFDNQHIVRALEFVQNYLHLDIRIDTKAVPPVLRKDERTEGEYFRVIDGKIKSTGYIPYIKLVDIPFQAMLKAVLIPLNLTYTYGNGFLVITSPERAKSVPRDQWEKESVKAEDAY